jgi:hypothetical protein
MNLKALTNPASDPGRVEIVLRMTAIILLLRPMGPWGVRPLILGLSGLAIALPRVLVTSATWYALAALITIRIIADWPLPDNHVYLLAYWCLAVALALGSRDVASTIRRSSRLLIGAAFLMAAIWKCVLSPDYLDGRFFSVTLLTDPRFENATLLLGGLTAEQLNESRDYLRPLPDGAELLDRPALAKTSAMTLLTRASTWGLLVLEAVIAFAYLYPLARRVVALRHVLLLLFCVVIYAVAPVAGFAWLLLTMGIALTGSKQRWLRGAYITAWCLILIYDEVPWSRLLVEWLGRG